MGWPVGFRKMLNIDLELGICWHTYGPSPGKILGVAGYVMCFDVPPLQKPTCGCFKRIIVDVFFGLDDIQKLMGMKRNHRNMFVQYSMLEVLRRSEILHSIKSVPIFRPYESDGQQYDVS